MSTLQSVDVLTGWSERLPVLGYEFDTVWRAMSRFDDQCSIPVRELHSDNDPECSNMALFSYFGAQMVHTDVGRGKPGCKSDNRFVEKKNGSLVRAYLQDLYLYTAEHEWVLNELYQQMRIDYNLNQPVLRQTARSVRIDANGVPHIIRKQDVARTPLTRLLRAKPPISRPAAQALKNLYDETNPRQLNRLIPARLARIHQVSHRDERRSAYGPG